MSHSTVTVEFDCDEEAMLIEESSSYMNSVILNMDEYKVKLKYKTLQV